MKKLSLLIVAFLFIANSAFAQFSWQMYDFGTGPFDHNNNWAPIDYPSGVGELPSPGLLGEGGEKFDLEGFNYKLDGSTVHVALTNSFGYSAYSTGWQDNYNLGDIFFGFDNNTYEYGIDVSTGNLYKVDSYVGIPDKPGTYYDYTDIRNAVGGWEIESGTLLGSVDNELSFWAGLETNPMQGNGDTWVWEFAFDASLVNGFASASMVNFHNILECGNDMISESYEIVPEPTTLLLFGLGALGLGIIRRRKSA